MQTIRITTSQNIDIDYEIAGVGERMVAYLVDLAIFVLTIIALAIILAIFHGADNYSQLLLIVMGITFFALFVFYDLVCEIFMNGQSVGKRVMKIKVISLDGSQATVGQYLLRWVFRIVDFTLTSGACGLISVAVSNKSQRVGDMVAGTTLIKTIARTKIDAIAFSPVSETYTPVFNEVSQLNDKDITLIHEVISSYIQSGNITILNHTAEKLKHLLSINTQMGDMQFLQTLLKDYNQIIAAAESL